MKGALAALVAIGAAAVGAAESEPASPAPAAPAEVAMCEAHARAALPDPSSYRRVSLQVADGPAGSVAAFDAAAGLVAPAVDDPRYVSWRVDHTIWSAHRLALRTLSLHFTSTAGEGQASCAFRLVDGLSEPEDVIRRHVQTSEGMVTLNQARAARGWTPIGQAARHACCL